MDPTTTPQQPVPPNTELTTPPPPADVVNELGQAPVTEPNAGATDNQVAGAPEPQVAISQPSVTSLSFGTPSTEAVNGGPAVFDQPSVPVMPTQPQQQPSVSPVATGPVASGPTPLGAPGVAEQKNNKTKIIIGIIIAVVILAIGAAFALSPKKETSNNSNGNSASKGTNESSGSGTKKGNELTASYMSEFSAVCTGSAISNAADYKGTAPHPITIFEKGVTSKDQYTGSSIYFSDASWTPDTKDYAKVQLVGCLTKKSTTSTGRKCDMEDDQNQKISVELFNVVYNLAIYEAKTGKKLADKEVSGPATDCPYFASYDPDDPKLFGDPDKGGATEAVKEFVTK